MSDTLIRTAVGRCVDSSDHLAKRYSLQLTSHDCEGIIAVLEVVAEAECAAQPGGPEALDCFGDQVENTENDGENAHQLIEVGHVECVPFGIEVRGERVRWTFETFTC